MRGLKSLVIGMGVLIVIGLTIVIVTLVNRYNSPDAGSVEEHASGISVPVNSGFGERRLRIPKGAKILDINLDSDRVVVTLDLIDGSQAILLINIVTGNRLGLIRLAPD